MKKTNEKAINAVASASEVSSTKANPVTMDQESKGTLETFYSTISIFNSFTITRPLNYREAARLKYDLEHPSNDCKRFNSYAEPTFVVRELTYGEDGASSVGYALDVTFTSDNFTWGLDVNGDDRSALKQIMEEYGEVAETISPLLKDLSGFALTKIGYELYLPAHESKRMNDLYDLYYATPARYTERAFCTDSKTGASPVLLLGHATADIETDGNGLVIVSVARQPLKKAYPLVKLLEEKDDPVASLLLKQILT
jgi:hypothetical protein